MENQDKIYTQEEFDKATKYIKKQIEIGQLGLWKKRNKLVEVSDFFIENIKTLHALNKYVDSLKNAAMINGITDYKEVKLLDDLEVSSQWCPVCQNHVDLEVEEIEGAYYIEMEETEEDYQKRFDKYVQVSIENLANELARYRQILSTYDL